MGVVFGRRIGDGQAIELLRNREYLQGILLSAQT